MELLGTPEPLFGNSAAGSPGVVWQYLTRRPARRRAGDLSRFEPGEQLASFVAQCYGSDRAMPHVARTRYRLFADAHQSERSPRDADSARIEIVGADGRRVPDAVVRADGVGRATRSAGRRIAIRPTGRGKRSTRCGRSPKTIGRTQSRSPASCEICRCSPSKRWRSPMRRTTTVCGPSLLRAHWGLTSPAGMLVADARHRRGLGSGESLCGPRALECVHQSAVGPGHASPPICTRSAATWKPTNRAARRAWPARSCSGSICWPSRSDARQRELANQIEQNYRNANVRLALSAELLQRFVPKQQSEMSPVRDRIVGTPVRGQSITTSENTVHLQPDAERWHVNLESDGTVDSDTVADGGQVQGPQSSARRVSRPRSRSSSSATACSWAGARPTPTTAATWSASAAVSTGCRS